MIRSRGISRRAWPLFLLFFLVTQLALARSVQLFGPDKNVRFNLGTDSSGRLVYSVDSGGKARLLPARAGIILDDTDLGAEAQIGASKTRRISEIFPWRGNKTKATNLCEVAEVSIHSKSTGLDWILEVRLFNGGVGFRYRVPGSGQRRVTGEATNWQLPNDCRIWFQTDTLNYEGVYQASPAGGLPLMVEAQANRAATNRVATHLGPPVTIIFEDGSHGLRLIE